MGILILTLGSQLLHRNILHIVIAAFIRYRTSDSPLYSLFKRFCLVPFLFLFLIGACATPSKDVVKENALKPEVSDRVRISEDYAVVMATSSDTYESLAEKFYRDRRLAYIIAEYNKNKKIASDKEVIVPLKPINPGGLYSEGYQTVPVLCYHQFSKKTSSSKISISEEMFDQQMEYLKNNGYTVISLNTLHNFLNYKRRPPKNSIVITIDDGWKTAKTIAAPILKKHGFTATLFIYTDLIRSKPNNVTLCWDEIKEMMDEGIVEVQSHTASHSDLTKLKEASIERELEDSQKIIKEHLGINVKYLAYPYGNFNDQVIDKLKKYGYEVAFTVIKGGNAFFYNNFSLNRSMVFNSNDIDDFTQLLETFKRE